MISPEEAYGIYKGTAQQYLRVQWMLTKAEEMYSIEILSSIVKFTAENQGAIVFTDRNTLYNIKDTALVIENRFIIIEQVPTKAAVYNVTTFELKNNMQIMHDMAKEELGKIADN